MIKKRGLGKSLSEMGVEALLGPLLAVDTVEQPLQSGSVLRMLPIHALKPGRYQPRRHMDPAALDELADSIKTQGIIQPILARTCSGGYEIVAGERRWLAAQKANLHEVPVVIRDLDDESTLAMSLIENIQRQDLNVVEEAMALQRLLSDFAMTHQEVATAIGRSRTSVTNVLRLLKLNADVLSLVEQRVLDMGHARALLSLEGEAQSAAAQQVVMGGLSVRETERLIQSLLQRRPVAAVQAVVEVKAPEAFQAIQNHLATQCGVKVNIKHHARGRGKLIFHYKNNDQLDTIIKYFSKNM